MDDAIFSTTGGLLTCREIRLLSLAELSLQPNQIMWDIGAGSGAVSIEAAQWQPGATIYAIEQRPIMCDHIHKNLRRIPSPNVHVIAGSAPAICADQPDPHAVFIGGSGGQLVEIIRVVRQRLCEGGRLVLALVTLENLQTARTCLPEARLVQVQIGVAVPILTMTRFQAHNPVFLLTYRKEPD